MKPLLERMHGARHIGLFAGLVMLALFTLVLTNVHSVSPSERTGETALERRLERLLSKIDGVGQVSVMITESDEGEILGAVIVAEGIKEIKPVLEIQTAVRTLLQLDAEHVSILGRQGSFGGALK